MSLPFLNSTFFESHSPSVELFHKWKDLASWNAEFIPLYEWNGILYIGKAQASPDFLPRFTSDSYVRETVNSLQKPHVILGAKPEDLAKLWSSFTTSSAASFELADEAPPVSNTEGESLELNSDSAAVSEMPDGLDFKMATPSSNTTVADDDPFAFLANQNVSAIQKVGAPPVPSLVSQPEVALPAEEEKTPAPVASSSVVIPVEASKTQQSTSTNEITIESIFDKLNAHFQRSMIFLIEANKATPWKWNEGFKLKNPSVKIGYDVNSPSPFRVVNRTLKPYHGTIPINKITQDFSKEWLKSGELKSCTACPIMNSGNLVGILLTTNDNDTVTKKELEFTEAAVKEIEFAMEEKSQILRAS